MEGVETGHREREGDVDRGGLKGKKKE